MHNSCSVLHRITFVEMKVIFKALEFVAFKFQVSLLAVLHCEIAEWVVLFLLAAYQISKQNQMK